MVVPSRVKEYSTAMAFDLVTFRAISPVNSSLRRVLVSMRWETLPMRRRNCPCRYGLLCSENKILGVHLPMKIGRAILDPWVAFIALCRPHKVRGTFCRGRHRPKLPALPPRAQLGTQVFLDLLGARGPFDFQLI